MISSTKLHILEEEGSLIKDDSFPTCPFCQKQIEKVDNSHSGVEPPGSLTRALASTNTSIPWY